MNDLLCQYRGPLVNRGNHESVYSCNIFTSCTLNDGGLTKNGKPLAVCSTCQQRLPIVAPFTPTKSFDRAVVINLSRRTDRREAIQKEFEKGWPFEVQPTIMQAIDGEKVVAPEGYKEGNNTWACLQSHRKAIEDSINNGYESVLILEDDAIFCNDFAQRALQFMTDIPNDWEFAFLGGHHFNKPPIAVKPGVTRPQHMDRMHAYAARGQGLIDLYRYWHQWHEGHCDHAISTWITTRKTYCAQPWLVGQRGGPSDVQRINGTGPQLMKGEEWWHSPGHTVAGGQEIPVSQQPLDFLQRAKSLFSVVGNTLKQGGRLVTQDIIDQRMEICKTCPAFDGKSCKLCGCQATRQSTYTNKLAHAASVCPMNPPRWGKYDTQPPLLSGCMPTRGRGERAMQSIKSFYETTAGHEREFIVLTHPDKAVPILKAMELDQVNYPGLQVHIADTDAISGWNMAFKHAKGQLIKIADDDLVFLPGWFDAVLKKWDETGRKDVALFGLYDDDWRVLANPPQLFTRSIGTRKFFMEVMGGVLCSPIVKRWWNDNITFDLAMKAGCAIPCMESRIDHHQAARGKGPWDETAQIGRDRGKDDEAIYQKWKSEGMPISWSPVVAG